VRNSNCDETLAVLAQVIVNTIPVIDPGGSTPDLVATEGSNKQPTAETEEDSNAVETCNKVLTRLSCLSDEARMAVDPYAAVYEPATNCITDLGEKLEFDLEMVRVMMNTWLFGSPRDAPFLLDPRALIDTDQIWRVAHRYDRWSKFSELALRFVSCSTSESDAERILSMQKNIAALHGTRFGIPGLEARIRCHKNAEGTRTQSNDSDNEDDPDDDSDGSD
jgi:hypothetical protein